MPTSRLLTASKGAKGGGRGGEGGHKLFFSVNVKSDTFPSKNNVSVTSVRHPRHPPLPLATIYRKESTIKMYIICIPQDWKQYGRDPPLSRTKLFFAHIELSILLFVSEMLQPFHQWRLLIPCQWRGTCNAIFWVVRRNSIFCCRLRHNPTRNSFQDLKLLLELSWWC